MKDSNKCAYNVNAPIWEGCGQAFKEKDRQP